MRKLRGTTGRFNNKAAFFKSASFKVQLIFLLSVAVSTYLSVQLSQKSSLLFRDHSEESCDDNPIVPCQQLPLGASPSLAFNVSETTAPPKTNPHQTVLSNEDATSQHTKLALNEQTTHREEGSTTATATGKRLPNDVSIISEALQQRVVDKAIESLNFGGQKFKVKLEPSRKYSGAKALSPEQQARLAKARIATQSKLLDTLKRTENSNETVLETTTESKNQPFLSLTNQQFQSLADQQGQPETSTSTTKMRKPPKVLMAITSTNMMSKRGKFDFRRRHLTRNTWLNFDPRHVPRNTVPIPDRTCSLQEYQNLTSSSDRDACKLVYTFLLAGRVKGNYTTNAHGKYYVKSRSKSNLTMDPSLFNGTFETDLLYMNVKENDRIGLGWAWYRHLLNLFEEQPSFQEDFDYIALTDADINIFPTEFWGNEIFQSNGIQTNIYAGYATAMRDVSCPACLVSKLKRREVMTRFVLLSKDLIPVVAESDPYHASKPDMKPSETPDIAIANVLVPRLQSIQHIHLHGIHPLKQNFQASKPIGFMGDALRAFDSYKDKLLTYEDPKEIALIKESNVDVGVGEHPRVLLGIFTMDSPEDKERRELIRNTYLSFLGKRICALNDLLSGKLEEPEQCQMAYTFVIGGNPMGPTELVDFNSSFPLTIDTSSGSQPKDDVVILNIKENMKEGKSQTWLKYALTVLDKVYFDYIAKADSDTVIMPNYFLDKQINKMPRFPNNIRTYAGDYRVKIPEKLEPHLGPVYMGGHFYFMSPDLARYITSPQCKRAELVVWSEDQSVGNFVHSHPLPIHRYHVLNEWYRHPAKLAKAYRRHWRTMNELLGEKLPSHPA